MREEGGEGGPNERGERRLVCTAGGRDGGGGAASSSSGGAQGGEVDRAVEEERVLPVAVDEEVGMGGGGDEGTGGLEELDGVRGGMEEVMEVM